MYNFFMLIDVIVFYEPVQERHFFCGSGSKEPKTTRLRLPSRGSK